MDGLCSIRIRTRTGGLASPWLSYSKAFSILPCPHLLYLYLLFFHSALCIIPHFTFLSSFSATQCLFSNHSIFDWSLIFDALKVILLLFMHNICPYHYIVNFSNFSCCVSTFRSFLMSWFQTHPFLFVYYYFRDASFLLFITYLFSHRPYPSFCSICQIIQRAPPHHHNPQLIILLRWVILWQSLPHSSLPFLVPLLHVPTFSLTMSGFCAVWHCCRCQWDEHHFSDFQVLIAVGAQS